MNQLATAVVKKSSWKKALGFTALFAAAFLLGNYSSIGVAGLLRISGGANILDFEFGFSAAQAHEMLTALGEEGRWFYLTRIQTLDILFPAAYMLCYASWIALLLRQLSPAGGLRVLLAVPVLAMLADWVENIGILVMLLQYPSLPGWAAAMASAAGQVKLISIAASIAVIVLLLAVLLGKWIAGRLRSTT